MEEQNSLKYQIAYLCAEFAVDDRLPIYSGGLGILAGDMLREAQNQNLPLVGIGLLYKQGYFTQVLLPQDGQEEVPAFLDTTQAPIRKVTDANGEPLTLKIYIAERTILVHTWEYREGQTRLLLLDTDVEGNAPLDRRLTLSLYPSDSEWRIQQEIILGVGGVRLLFELHMEPEVYHLNEGHSAFALLEIAHQHMKRHASRFEEALSFAKQKVVFTNHTLIPSGNDVFDKELVKKLLTGYAQHLGLSIDEVLAMGSTPHDPKLFSMTHLALQSARASNAVSRSHAQFARVAWPDSHLVPITNGVNRPFWQAQEMSQFFDQYTRGEEVESGDLWETHQHYKRALLKTVHSLTENKLSEHRLTLVWARRIAAYKQPLLIFHNLSELKRIITKPGAEVQILLAGKAHPGDEAAKSMIRDIFQIIEDQGLGDYVAYLPNYSLALAKDLTRGADVWLNTPLKGQEACGTSGMKSAMNGSLQMAISDGWTDEIPLEKLGFSINPLTSAPDFLALLENIVAPLYYQREDEIPEQWVSKMQQTITVVTERFNTTRMLSEYKHLLYSQVPGYNPT